MPWVEHHSAEHNAPYWHDSAVSKLTPVHNSSPPPKCATQLVLGGARSSALCTNNCLASPWPHARSCSPPPSLQTDQTSWSRPPGFTGSTPTISGTVVGSDGDMTTHHKGGALEADVSAADVELAAMNAKPSNVIVGCVTVLAMISFACTIASTSSPSWLNAGNTRRGLFERCEEMSTGGSYGSVLLTDGKYKPCWDGGDVTPAFEAPFTLTKCTRWARNEDKEPEDSRNWVSYKAVRSSVCCGASPRTILIHAAARRDAHAPLLLRLHVTPLHRTTTQRRTSATSVTPTR